MPPTFQKEIPVRHASPTKSLTWWLIVKKCSTVQPKNVIPRKICLERIFKAQNNRIGNTSKPYRLQTKTAMMKYYVEDIYQTAEKTREITETATY